MSTPKKSESDNDEVKEWVDFQEVKAAVSMKHVLDHYGITGLRKYGNSDDLRGSCPVHAKAGETETTKDFSVSLQKNAFRCFKCKARGNILDLVAGIEKCSVRDAAIKIKHEIIDGEPGKVEKRGADKIQQPPESKIIAEAPATSAADNVTVELPQIKRGIYRHFKGGFYFVEGVAIGADGEEPLVFYTPMYGDFVRRYRSLVNFTEQVEQDGQSKTRFTLFREL